MFIGGGTGGPGGPGGGVKSPCHPNPCMNGGTCAENGGGYDCACLTQYSGPNCESKHYYLSSCSFLPMARIYLLRSVGGIYISLIFTVDECEKCDVNAICANGHCRCKHGYYGNGYQCEKGGE